MELKPITIHESAIKLQIIKILTKYLKKNNYLTLKIEGWKLNYLEDCSSINLRKLFNYNFYEDQLFLSVIFSLLKINNSHRKLYTL